MESKGSFQHLEFEIPSRGLIGLRSIMLTTTAGNAIMAHRFTEFKQWKGTIGSKRNGVLISKEKGTATAYSIDKLQERGKFFIDPGTSIYTGQIIGENSRSDDLVVNVCQGKKLTNVRASGTDDAVGIAPKVEMTLEECMEYIEQDECIEITPENIRLRKILLDETDRKRQGKSM